MQRSKTKVIAYLEISKNDTMRVKVLQTTRNLNCHRTKARTQQLGTFSQELRFIDDGNGTVIRDACRR